MFVTLFKRSAGTYPKSELIKKVSSSTLRSKRMETLGIKDLHQLNQAIQRLYTIQNLDTFGLDTLKIIDRLVPSEIPSFQSTHLQTRQLSGILLHHSPDFFTPELQKVVCKYYGEHPIAQHMQQTIGGAYKISDFITQSKFYCLEGLYQQYLGLFGMEDQMTLFLPQPSTRDAKNTLPAEPILVGFALNRTRRSFTERDRLILNLLRPHLFQAYTNAQKYQQLQRHLSQAQQSLNHLGVVILDTKGKIYSIAPQAIIWLETYFSKSTCLDRLPDHLWAWVKHQIAGENKPDLPTACPPLRIQQADRELTIRLVIDSPDPRCLLLMEEQTLSCLNSLELLGLSQRETEVLALIMQGKDNKSISIQMNIRIGTTRKHLENIYLKLGVQSRTEAIAYALAKMGLLHSLPLI